MIKADTATRRRLADVALGYSPADLVIRGGRLIEVHTGTIVDTDIAIKGERIAVVGDVSSAIGSKTEIIDASGFFLTPGFVDCHIHVGGSQLGMTEFARLVIPHGTGVICTDFKEAGTIAGLSAVKFFLEEAEKTPLKVLFAGFPALGLARLFNPEDFRQLLAMPNCVEVREWNCYLEQRPLFQEWIDAARKQNMLISGHLEGQNGPILQASVALGVCSDHETVATAEALEKVRLGVRLQARQGSAAWDLPSIMRAVTEYQLDTRSFMFCTDEAEAQHLERLGHMDWKVRMAIDAGISPIVAVQMATLNAAEYFHMESEFGSIAPGRLAHINMVKDLNSFVIDAVIADGKLVAEHGRYTAQLDRTVYPAEFYRTVHVPGELTPKHFVINAPGTTATVRVIGIHAGGVPTEERLLSLPVKDGIIEADPALDLAKIAVLERHEGSGRIGKAFVQGLHLNLGAFAATFNLGNMNVMVVGVNDADMALAAQRIRDLQGGVVVVLNGQVIAELALPVLGIIADQTAGEVVEAMQAIEDAIRTQLECNFDGVLTAAGYCMLTISIPSLKIGDKGLVRVRRDGVELVDLVVMEDASQL